MNRIFTYFAICFSLVFSSQNAQAQLQVNANNSPEALVQNLLGDGVEVLNVSLNCPDGAVGIFEAQFTNLGLQNGVLLTSGSIQNAIGPNNQSSESTSNFTPGDSDLNSLIPGFTTNDACVLEITFIPYGETLSFNYVFGSEEYEGYVCSTFNDVFGFFIEGGTEYPTPTNIALIPNTNLPVSINSVNIGESDGNSQPCYLDNTQYYVDNGSGTVTLPNSTIQYDGFTVLLPATAAVTPCQPYTLKMAVADAGDTSLDSGVFIQAGSFSVNSFFVEATTTLTSIEGFDFTVEECVDGIITFSRNFVSEDPITIDFELGGTAVNGEDYELITNTITIAGGETEVDLVIQTIEDGLDEEPETITISLTNELGCDTALVQLVSLEIVDATPISVSPDITILQGESAQLFVEGGGLNYFWSPTESLDNFNSPMPIAMPEETTTYTVNSLLGNCFYTQQVTVTVLPFTCQSDAGTFTNTNQIVVCNGDSFTINQSDYTTAAVDTFDSVIAIHTVGDSSLGEIIAVSSSTEPTFDLSNIQGIEYNTVYYISRIVDLQDPTGTVDIENGLCVQVATGPQLVYLAPITISSDYTCDNNTGNFTIEYTFSGGLPSFDGSNYNISGDVQSQLLANASISISYPTNSFLNIAATDNLNCSGSFSDGPLECTKCQAIVGNILSNSPAAICETASFIPILDGTVIASSNVEEFCGLFSSSELSIDNLIYVDEDCEFTFDEVSPLGTGPFYVGNFIAAVEANGEIDFLAGCTKFTSSPTQLILGLQAAIDFSCNLQQPPYSATIEILGSVGNATLSINGVEITGTNNVFVVDNIETLPFTLVANDPFGCSLSAEYDFGDVCVTAVELLSFRAASQQTGNALLWQTASEVNTHYFTIEKSKNGIDFENIGTVQARGKDNGATYEYFDADTKNTLLYYRLKETDFNHKNTYSDIIVLQRTLPQTQIDIYPNPVNDILNIDLNVPFSQTIQIAIFDLSGKKLQNIEVATQSGLNYAKINTQDLPSGMYFIEIGTPNGITAQKIIKQ